MGVWATIKMMVREEQIMNRSIKCVTYKALISPLFFSDPYYFREGLCGRSLPKHRSNSVHEQKYVLSYYKKRKKNLGQNITCSLPFAQSTYIWFLSAWALQDFITVFKSCVSIRKYAGHQWSHQLSKESLSHCERGEELKLCIPHHQSLILKLGHFPCPLSLPWWYPV